MALLTQMTAVVQTVGRDGKINTVVDTALGPMTEALERNATQIPRAE